jgi:hypothetical protein
MDINSLWGSTFSVRSILQEEMDSDMATSLMAMGMSWQTSLSHMFLPPTLMCGHSSSTPTCPTARTRMTSPLSWLALHNLSIVQKYINLHFIFFVFSFVNHSSIINLTLRSRDLGFNLSKIVYVTPLFSIPLLSLFFLFSLVLISPSPLLSFPLVSFFSYILTTILALIY